MGIISVINEILFLFFFHEVAVVKSDLGKKKILCPV